VKLDFVQGGVELVVFVLGHWNAPSSIMCCAFNTTIVRLWRAAFVLAGRMKALMNSGY
jgi:hypothetical protein